MNNDFHYLICPFHSYTKVSQVHLLAVPSYQRSVRFLQGIREQELVLLLIAISYIQFINTSNEREHFEIRKLLLHC